MFAQKEGAREKPSWPAPSFFACRPLFTGVCCMAAGILLAEAARGSPPLAAMMVVAAVAALLFGRKRLRVLALCFVLGAGNAAWRLRAPDLPPVGAWTVEGTICGEVRVHGEGAGCDLKDVTVFTSEGGEAALPGRLYVYFAKDGASGLVCGQRVRAEGKAYALEGRRNPGGEDERLTMARRGVVARLYAPEMVRVTGEAGFSLTGWALAARNALCARMDALFGAASPVARAMLLGDAGGMPEDWRQWMNRGGVAHLLAVSGLHVALWFVLLRRLIQPLHARPWQRLLLLTALLMLYALLTGLRDSVLRASVMLLTLETARVARRKADPLTSLALAAGIILLFRPLDLFSAGFQLSFGAVLGLCLVKPLLTRRAPDNFLGKVWGNAATTAAAQLGALPAMASCFGMVSVAGLAANLLAVPLAGLLLPCGALAVALDAVWTPLAAVPAQVTRGLAAMLLRLAQIASQTPVSAPRVPCFAPWTTAAWWAGLFLCCDAVVWSARARLRAAALATALAVACGLCFAEPRMFYEQLDVDEGLCGVLHVGAQRYVYDCGEAGGGLADYLRRYAGGVEAVVLSHPHYDHCDGLADLLREGVPIGVVCVPENAGAYGQDAEYDALLQAVREAGIPVVELSAGDWIHTGKLTVEVLAPERAPGRGTGPNDRSLALRVEAAGYALLFTGDGDGATEPWGVPCDVLQVAHHGSARASNPKALEGMSPRVALISCGNSPYHPDAETVERLERAGAEVFVTRESGAIRVILDENGLAVEEFCR